jgi:hypothetical protein
MKLKRTQINAYMNSNRVQTIKKTMQSMKQEFPEYTEILKKVN